MDSKKLALKIWKIIITVHGVFLFFFVYESLIMVIASPYVTLWDFIRELITELIREPEMIFYYGFFSLIFNLFTIPRLMALYRFIKAIITGNEKLMHVLYYIMFIFCQVVLLWFFSSSYLAKAHKPVIYLYPETRTEVSVRLELDGNLTATYPNYDPASGWTVTAEPDGTLTDKKGRQYSYLFWEGDINIRPDMNTGFCVKGEDTERFLEDSLKQLGLNDKEACDFITYWLPMMQENKYNVIMFQTKAYEDVASLHVAPGPDTVIRVNMLWYSSEVPLNIRPQDLGSFNPSVRKGFTVVEWGGEDYKKGPLRIESVV